MDDQTAARPNYTSAPETVEPSVYEQMWRSMYDYRFGRITFLELLDRWREVLGLPVARD